MTEMQDWMEHSQARETERQQKASKQLKLTKLTEAEDVGVIFDHF